jgi:hypothetical protein
LEPSGGGKIAKAAVVAGFPEMMVWVRFEKVARDASFSMTRNLYGRIQADKTMKN